MTGMKTTGTIALTALMTAGLLGAGGTYSFAASHATRHAAPAVHLVLTMFGSPLDVQTYQERANLYTKMHPNVTVTVKLLNNYDQEVETMIAGGDAPDIMEVSQDAVGFGAKGAVLNLNPYIKAAHLNLNKRFYPGYIDQYNYKGAQYAIPDRGGFMAMYVNKTMFAKAHLALPTPDWTWSTFLHDAQKLTIRQGGKTSQWGLSIDQWWPKYGSFIHEAGGQVLNNSETASTVNSAAAKTALQFYRDWMFKYDVTPNPNEWADLGAGMNADALFGKGEAAMMPTGLWDIAPFNQAKLNYEIVTMPRDKRGGTEAVGTGLAVCADSKNPQVAFDVVDFMTSFKGEVPIVTNKEDIPANRKASDMWYREQLGVIAPDQWTTMNQEIFSPHIPPTWNQWQGVIGNELGLFFDQKLTIGEAAQTIVLQSKNALAGVQ